MSESNTGGRKGINAIKLVFLAFYMVSGGPNGIEGVVGAAGGFWTLVAFVFFPVFYCMPQALMTAELSSMMADNGGYVIWVRRALGDFPGWMNSFNSAFCNLVDNTLYPMLVTRYLHTKLPHVSGFAVYCIQVGVVILTAIVNMLGVEIVADVSIVLTAVVVAPFVIMLVYRFPFIDPSIQWVPLPMEEVKWGNFAGLVIWLYTGWDGLSTIAGDVVDPQKSYFWGLTGANFLITTVNIIPIVACLTFSVDTKDWVDGYLSDAAEQTAGYLGWWVVVAFAISNFGLFMANMLESANALWAMGRDSELGRRQIPRCFGLTLRRYGTPWFAIIFQSIVTCFLMRLDLAFLTNVDTILNCVSLLLEFASFIRLRYTEPDAPRPFKVPGGFPAVWALTLPKVHRSHIRLVFSVYILALISDFVA